MWRDTMLAVRIGPFDARVLVTSVFWLAHMRWWTFAVALAGAVVFSALGWLGLSLPALVRTLRRLVAAGTQLRPFPREVMQACYKAAFELYDETAAKNATFKKCFDHWRAFRDSQNQWFRVAESGFDNFGYFMHAQEQQRR